LRYFFDDSFNEAFTALPWQTLVRHQ